MLGPKDIWFPNIKPYFLFYIFAVGVTFLKYMLFKRLHAFTGHQYFFIIYPSE